MICFTIFIFIPIIDFFPSHTELPRAIHAIIGTKFY